MSDNPINGLKRKRPFPILVVEDNQDHQLIIQYGLLGGMPGADAIFASSAEEALAYLKIATLTRTDFPRVVLLTIYLPTTPISWRLLKEIRLVYPLLPVVALSTTLDGSVIKQAYEFGVSSFLTKPTSLPEWVHNFQVFNEYWLNTVTLPPRQSNG